MFNSKFDELKEVSDFKGLTIKVHKLFNDGGRYHIETSPANQWTGFYMITAYVMKEIKKLNV